MRTDDLQMPIFAPCSRRTIRTPHACTKYVEIGEIEQCCIVLRLEIKANPSRITPAKLLVAVYRYFAGWADFDLFVHFENTAKASWIVGDVLALANPVCLHAVSLSDRHGLALLPCAGLIARTYTSYIYTAKKEKEGGMEKEGSSSKTE